MSGKIASKLDIICCRGIQGKGNAFLGWMLHNRLHRLGDFLIKEGSTGSCLQETAVRIDSATTIIDYFISLGLEMFQFFRKHRHSARLSADIGRHLHCELVGIPDALPC